MEVEAKFSFQDGTVFAGWLGRRRLGPFTLDRPRTVTVLDAYLDGPGYPCLRAGYACRIRLQPVRATATLKSLADAVEGEAGPVRRRDELEVDLEAPAAAVASEHTLELPADWLQPVAWPESAARGRAVGLLGSATLHHLATLHQERHEREIRDGSRLVATLSLDRVRFDRGQPDVFELEAELAPDGDEADLQAIVAALRHERGFAPQMRSKLARALDGLPNLPPIEDRTALQSAHTAEAQALRLLAALVPAGPDRDAFAARVRVLLGVRAAGADAEGEPLADAVLRAALAVLSLNSHRDGRSRGRSSLAKAIATEPALTAFAEAERTEALRSAALVAVAEQLARLAERGLLLSAVTTTERRSVLALRRAGGDGHGGAGLHALRPLWRVAFGRTLRATIETGSRGSAIGLRFDSRLADAGRQLLAAQFARLRDLEPALRGVATVDAVHDARVAGRRLRTTLHLFRRAYPRRDVRAVDAGLQRLVTMLGAVRDLDVLGELLDERVGGLGTAAAELSALHQEWMSGRQREQAALAAYLDGPAYREWLARMAAFLESSSSTERGTEPLYGGAPALIWKQYGAVRTAGRDIRRTSLPGLHALRKQSRRLRYLLESLNELLDRRSHKLAEACVRLQDALGALHDADQLRNELGRYAQRQSSPPPVAVQRLQEQTEAELPALRRAVEADWPAVNGRAFRRRLGRSVASL